MWELLGTKLVTFARYDKRRGAKLSASRADLNSAKLVTDTKLPGKDSNLEQLIQSQPCCQLHHRAESAAPCGSGETGVHSTPYILCQP